MKKRMDHEMEAEFSDVCGDNHLSHGFRFLYSNSVRYLKSLDLQVVTVFLSAPTLCLLSPFNKKHTPNRTSYCAIILTIYTALPPKRGEQS